MLNEYYDLRIVSKHSYGADTIEEIIRRAEKLGLKKTAGSDAHMLEMIGASPIKTDAQDMDSVLKNIKNGSVELEKRYLERRLMVKWIYERMKRSYPDVIRYVDSSYSRPKAAVSKLFINHFVKNPENMFWRFLMALSINAYFLQVVVRPRTYF